MNSLACSFSISSWNAFWLRSHLTHGCEYAMFQPDQQHQQPPAQLNHSLPAAGHNVYSLSSMPWSKLHVLTLYHDLQEE